MIGIVDVNDMDSASNIAEISKCGPYNDVNVLFAGGTCSRCFSRVEPSKKHVDNEVIM